MRRRRFLAILLAMVMMATMAPTSVFAAGYGDAENHWASTEINRWSEYGILKGNAGMFRPSEPITRAEMATIIDRVLLLQEKGDNAFSDLPEAWYTDALLRANAAGIVLGSAGKARPTDNVTRQEAAVMICRALEINEVAGKTGFSDDTLIAPWAKGFVQALSAKGLISGVGNNKFAPKANMDRASVVKILDNAIKGFYHKAGEYASDVTGNVVINSPDVSLKDMEIKGDLIIAEGVGDGDVHLDNVKIAGNTVVRGGGKNSLYFNSVTVGGALIVNKVGGDLRIVATGTTSVSVVVLESGAILVTKDLVGGGIEKVVIPASIAAGQNIVLDGHFATVENNSASVAIQATGTIDTLLLNEKTTLTGDAVVLSVTTAAGADSVVNGKPISGGNRG